MKKSRNFAAGFTLVEVAAVVLVGGLMLTSATSVLNDSLEASRTTVTQSRMQEINDALQLYLSVNGALPCPSSFTDTPDVTPAFGRSINEGPLTTAAITALPYNIDVNDCANTAAPGTLVVAGNPPPPPVANPANFNNNVVIGAVPVRTLNLPDQDMTDAWGSRFVYAVTDYLTVSSIYNPGQGTIGIVDGSSLAGAPIIGTGSGISPISYAQYVILSYGADRAGAYTLAGVKGSACPAGNLETKNCTFTAPLTFRKAPIVGGQTGANYFDDYILYHALNDPSTQLTQIPSGMVQPFNGMSVCPTGWSLYGLGGSGAGIAPLPSGTGTLATPGTCVQPVVSGTPSGVCCEKN